MKNFILIMLLTTLTTTTVFARAEGRRGELRKIFSQLDLTQEQKDSLRKMRKENKGKFKSTRGEGKKLREQLQKAFVSGESDSTLEGLHNQIKELRMQRMDRRFNKLKGIKSILNSEQRKKFFELHKNMRRSRRS